jgi:hypothetical protein
MAVGMGSIPRVIGDRDLVEEGIEGDRGLLASVLDSAARRPVALSLAIGTARRYAGYISAGRDDPAEIRRALALTAHAAAASFALASGSGPLELPLGDRTIKLDATGPTDMTHAGAWRVGWWAAHIVRDDVAIERLAATPVEVLRASSAREDECAYLFVEALQGFHYRTPEWSNKLQEAVEATDPDATKLVDDEFALEILVPEMQLLYCLALGEVPRFAAALEHALARHAKYWTRGERKRDPDGFLALGPLALASLARDLGLPIDVRSGYLLCELVTGA